MRSLPALFVASLLVAACGGSDPGSGTQTLYVQAEAHQQGSDPTQTTVTVVVRQGSSNGEILNTAVVTLRDADGNDHTVPWQGLGKLGLYAVGGLDWSPGWSIRVESGDDGLEASLDAPGPTQVTAPAEGSIFHKSSSDPLTIEWKDAGGKSADHVRVRLQKASYDRTFDQDDHHLDIDPGALVVDDKEQVHVIRWNEISLAGGTAGSYFRATTEDQVQFQVAQ